MPEINLYEYQAKAIDDLREAFLTHNSVLFCLPTGGGKTMVAAKICQLFHLRNPHGKALFLVHRQELVDQIEETLSLAGFRNLVGRIVSSHPAEPWKPFQIATVQTLSKRKINYEPSLIIVDECHHGAAKTWSAQFDRWPNVRKLGLTATPHRYDGKGLKQCFSTIVYGPTISELISMGRLAEYDMYTIDAGIKSDDKGNPEDKINQMLHDKIMVNVLESFDKFAKGKRTLFFAHSLQASESFAEILRGRGVSAEHVDATTPKIKRKQIIKGFSEGSVTVVCNVGLFGEGLDIPGCEVVILGRPTGSLSLYLQQVGRGMRAQPGKRALILDLVGCAYRHGLPDEDRSWSLDGVNKKEKKTEEEQSLVSCLRCHLLSKTTPPICPKCGFVKPVSRTGEMFESDNGLVKISDSGQLHRKKKSVLSTAEMRSRLNIIETEANGNEGMITTLLEQMQVELGYKPGWVGHVKKYRMGL